MCEHRDKRVRARVLYVHLSVYVCVCVYHAVAQYGSSWHTSSATIVSSYSAFSKQRTTADIGGYIGLMHINITYRRKYLDEGFPTRPLVSLFRLSVKVESFGRASAYDSTQFLTAVGMYNWNFNYTHTQILGIDII